MICLPEPPILLTSDPGKQATAYRGKALAPVADGLLEAWGATKNLGLNIEALRTELLLVKATLELAGGKQIHGQASGQNRTALEELLWKLRDWSHCAEDLLDELDYFRIHDQLHGTYDAADQHAMGGVHDLALNARHAAKAVGKLSFISSLCCSTPSPAGDPGEGEDARQQASCCAWPRARHRSRGNSSSAPKASQEVSVCTPKLGKLAPCSPSPDARDDHSVMPTLSGAPQRETPMLGFNRVDVSQRMMHIVEQLQPVRKEVTQILQGCDRRTVPDIAQSRAITTSRSIEPKLYGRNHIVDTIIHDMTKGKYHDKDLTVLPIVGPGGIGKTTLVQHIYHNKQVQNHFHVVIWVCISLSFNLNKLFEDIKKCIPPVEGEKGDRPEELIAQRLKSKKFLLVLDDIWEISNEDDWKRLLFTLKTSEENGCVILLTSRFLAIAKKVKATNNCIELKGLESEEFRKLFLAFVFGDEPIRSDHNFLLKIGDKIMEKLKGSPLAAKTVGTLLREDLNLRHWLRVLESKEWETQVDANDIMPALKLSYDHLLFHQQQCFSYSALYPEDHNYSSTELINLWIGLDILQPAGQNQTLEDIGLSILNYLVTHGFFREEKANGQMYYVMHDLLHDLAFKVASHECLTLNHSNVRSVEIHSTIRHLSIIIDDDEETHENFKSELRKLKTRLKVKQLHTLMLFGEVDESFGNILGDLFREANALRVLRLVNMPFSVDSMLPNFSSLIHLRYLCLGTDYGSEMHLPIAISRFFHLRILDLGSWYRCCDLPKELSNLSNLCRFYTESPELHSHICNVEKLKFLEELMVFRVKKESAGFEPKQLEHLVELRELGIYNLENVHTEEEAAITKLMEKSHLERLTLDWDSKWSSTEPGVEAVVLESLQPHRYLQELCIRGHRGSCRPTWLGDKLAVEALEALHLSGVSWELLPPLGKMWGLGKVILHHIATIKEFVIEQSFCRLIRLELVGLGSFGKWVSSQGADHLFPLLQVLIIRECPKLLELPFSNQLVDPRPDQDRDIDWFPKLQELEIKNCPELLLVARIPWTESLSSVYIRDVKLLEEFSYGSKSSHLRISGKDDLQSLDEVVAFHNMAGLEDLSLQNCPPLQLKNLLMLTSLKKLIVESSLTVGGEDDVEWQHPVEHLVVQESSCGGKELTELLTHLPRLSALHLSKCKAITQLAVGQQTTGGSDDSGLLLLPAHLSHTLQYLTITNCPELVLVDPRGAGAGGLQALQSLVIYYCPKLLSARSSFSCCLFPSSLQRLNLRNVEGMGTLEPLSNLTSLTHLTMRNCGEDLRCKGLGPLITAGGRLRNLAVLGSPRFLAGWDLNPKWVQLQDGTGEEQELQQLVSFQSSSKLQNLWMDDVMGLLAAPICSFLSSSLTELCLCGTFQEMERFTRKQEDALHLLAYLQQLVFWSFDKLLNLPAGLHKLTNLKKLEVFQCPAVQSLPEDGLPKSLQELDVSDCGNEELKQQCRGLVGTIPKIKLERGY